MKNVGAFFTRDPQTFESPGTPRCNDHEPLPLFSDRCDRVNENDRQPFELRKLPPRDGQARLFYLLVQLREQVFFGFCLNP